jgi:hypothetical protein
MDKQQEISPVSCWFRVRLLLPPWSWRQTIPPKCPLAFNGLHCLTSPTHSLRELSPSWGAANCGATQKLTSILWNPKVHYRVHKSLPVVPILRQMNPIHTIPSYLKSILILSTNIRLVLPSGLLPSVFPTNTLHAFLLSHVPFTCAVNLILLDLIILIMLREEYKLWSPSLCSFFQPPVTSTFFGLNILNTLSWKHPQPMFVP